MSRYYRNDDEQRGYDDCRKQGRFSSYPYSESYDYRQGWEDRATEERREEYRREEREQEEAREEAEQRWRHEEYVEEQRQQEEECFRQMEQQPLPPQPAQENAEDGV